MLAQIVKYKLTQDTVKAPKYLKPKGQMRKQYVTAVTANYSISNSLKKRKICCIYAPCKKYLLFDFLKN